MSKNKRTHWIFFTQKGGVETRYAFKRFLNGVRPDETTYWNEMVYLLVNGQVDGIGFRRHTRKLKGVKYTYDN